MGSTLYKRKGHLYLKRRVSFVKNLLKSNLKTQRWVGQTIYSSAPCTLSSKNPKPKPTIIMEATNTPVEKISPPISQISPVCYTCARAMFVALTQNHDDKAKPNKHSQHGYATMPHHILERFGPTPIELFSEHLPEYLSKQPSKHDADAR